MTIKAGIDSVQGNVFVDDAVNANGVAADTTSTRYRKDYLRYIITNPSAEEITIDLEGANTSYWMYNSDGVTVSSLQTGDNAAGAGYPAVDVTGGVITTSATKILVEGAGSLTANTVEIDATSITDNVTVTVQAFLDYVGESMADGDPTHSLVEANATTQRGKVNTNEYATAVQTINLWAPTNVGAVTRFVDLNNGSADFELATLLSNDINADQVAADIKFAVFQGSVSQNMEDHTGANATLASGVYRLAYVAGDVYDDSELRSGDVETLRNADDTADAPAGTGYWTAQAYYGAGNIAMGSASQAVDLTSGGNATVAGIKLSVADSKDVLFTTPNVEVRSGTKAVSSSIQAMNGTNDNTAANVVAANIQVRAIVTGTNINSGSSVTVSGAAGTMTKDDDVVTAVARTNSQGIATFTFNNTVGKSSDELEVVYSVKNNAGQWVDTTTSVVEWITASYTDLTIKPAEYVSGENPTVTVTAVDQFGVGVDKTSAGKSLSVFASAYLSGVESLSTFSQSKNTTNGAASFTFKNFAPVGGSAVLKAVLYETQGASSTQVAGGTIQVRVYNTLGTDKIAIATSTSTEVTYSDYVTGDSSDSAVAAKVAATEIDAAMTSISGSVLNVNNVGQPGMPVTVSAKGVLFRFDGVYSLDTVTAYANEFGDFSVDVATHKLAPSGETITISAGGKTATTLLKSYLPATGVGASNLKLDVKLPGFVVVNRTYAVRAKLTDKWGNPIATSNDALTVTGAGSTSVNNVNQVIGDFNSNGETVFFIRSLKNQEGPAILSFELEGAGKYSATSAGTATTFASLATVSTDDINTAWNETAFRAETSINTASLPKRPTATITKPAKGTTVVVTGAKATEITVTRGTRTKTVLTNTNVTTVKLKLGKGEVNVYVNGKRIARG
jgi:hypothetical protein